MSPLGRYAEGVAAIVSLALVSVWLVVLLLGGSPAVELTNAAWVALGYIFGTRVGDAAARAVVATSAAAAAVTSQNGHSHDDASKP